ncbi:SIR2 family protein [Mesorhizobium sp.]|uniref:SIR2 family protein n=1 Tax=Mesorhizobium sp. TaxID=1871066 RepID=UPI000FE75AE8|nr:SIR2 family protein [Mesorhizobium sp.]RWD94257.1 MAG: cold-shock protein [Mesorhizobium sp.]TIV52679.1 MAG: cold-shock protein [Mesorhizobium sp.]
MHQRDETLTEFADNWSLFGSRLVIFLGAGASIGARNAAGAALPSAYELRNNLWQRFKHSGARESFDPSELRLMSLEHASAIIEEKTGRTALSEYLVDVFSCDKPLWQHLVMPFMRPAAMFTTNYDELIELGYKSQPGVLDVICSSRDPIKPRTALYKPHGSLTHANQPIGQGGLVITQFDYLEMITEYRNMLQKAMTAFSSTCVLLIGYSFGDMDIAAELYSIRKKHSGIPWYAVFPRNDPQVKRMYSKKFGIEQINRKFEDFLVELDEQINFIPDELKRSRLDELSVRGVIQ